MNTRTGRNCGREMKRIRGNTGGKSPRAVVVTVIVDACCGGIDEGLAEHCVLAAGREQVRLAVPLKPLRAKM